MEDGGEGARGARRRHHTPAPSKTLASSAASSGGQIERSAGRSGAMASFGAGRDRASGSTLRTANAAVPPASESASPVGRSRQIGGSLSVCGPGVHATTG